MWYLRTQDETFGPVSADQLIEWARLGRIQPGQEVSEDNATWRRVEGVPFLDMRFSIDIGDGNPRGPFNKYAAEALLASGRLPATAKIVETVEEVEGLRGCGVEEVEGLRSCGVEEAAETAQGPAGVEIVEKVVEVEKIVEKVVVDDTRVKELEGLLDEEMKATAELKAELVTRVSELSNLQGELKVANARAEKLTEQVEALEDELKRLPAAASEVADIQAAVFKLMQDEAAELEGEIEREKRAFEDARQAHTAKLDGLVERRREILKRGGSNVEDMTRKALVNRPEDPRMAILRHDYEELQRQHERTVHAQDVKIRQLNDQLGRCRAQEVRAGESLKDVTQLQAEVQQLRELLQRTEKDLMSERQKCEEMRQREATSQQVLMARLATLESPSIGTAQSLATNQSREAHLVKLPSWMRLKK